MTNWVNVMVHFLDPNKDFILTTELDEVPTQEASEYPKIMEEVLEWVLYLADNPSFLYEEYLPQSIEFVEMGAI